MIWDTGKPDDQLIGWQGKVNEITEYSNRCQVDLID